MAFRIARGAILLGLAVVVSACSGPSQRQAELTKNLRPIVEDAGVATFVSEGCASLGINQTALSVDLGNIRQSARAAGGDDADFNTVIATLNEDPDELGEAVGKRIRSAGLNPSSATDEEICRFGRDQILQGSRIGRYLM